MRIDEELPRGPDAAASSGRAASLAAQVRRPMELPEVPNALDAVPDLPRQNRWIHADHG